MYTCISALGVNRIGNRKGIRKEEGNEKGKAAQQQQAT
jgi:hypothetical protein